MPEGPEIRRAADRVARVLVGEQLDEVSFAFPSLQPYEDQLASSSVPMISTTPYSTIRKLDGLMGLVDPKEFKLHCNTAGLELVSEREKLLDSGKTFWVGSFHN